MESKVGVCFSEVWFAFLSFRAILDIIVETYSFHF